MRISKLSMAALSITLLCACETPTDQAIEQARSCTDNAAKLAFTQPAAAATAAESCEQILVNANATTAEALKIQFGDVLIEDQILANMGQVASKQKSNGGNIDGINSMLPILLPVPPASHTAAGDAGKLQTLAVEIGSPGMIYVASLINMAVTLNNVAGGVALDPSDPTQTLADLNTCKTDQACSDTVASAFESMAAGACASPYDQTSTDPNNLCFKAKAIEAAAGPNPTTEQLVTALAAYASQTH